MLDTLLVMVTLGKVQQLSNAPAPIPVTPLLKVTLVNCLALLNAKESILLTTLPITTDFRYGPRR